MKKTNRDTERFCRFCERATTLHNGEEMLCSKYGIVSGDYVCRSFCYDPLKRDPGAPLVAPKLEYVDLDEVSPDEQT